MKKKIAPIIITTCFLVLLIMINEKFNLLDRVSLSDNLHISEKNKAIDVNDVTNIEGIEFSVPKSTLRGISAISTISSEMELESNIGYLFKDKDSIYIQFKMDEYVIIAKKGTDLGMLKKKTKEEQLKGLQEFTYLNTWFDKIDKKIEIDMIDKKQIIKTIGRVGITKRLFGDFYGKLATISNEGSEWSLFVGVNATDIKEVGNDEWKLIDSVIDSLHMVEDEEVANDEYAIEVGGVPSAASETQDIESKVPTEITTTAPIIDSVPNIAINTEVGLEITNQEHETREVDKAYETNIYKMLNLSDKGIISMGSDKAYVVPLKIYKQDEARDIIKKGLTEAFRPVFESARGTSFHLLEYSLENDTKNYIDIKLLGIDGEKLVFRGIEYNSRTYTFIIDGKNYVFYEVPNGIKEYVLRFGSGDGGAFLHVRV